MQSKSSDPVSLADALGVTRVDANTYKAFMHPDHGHGGSAHGGFVASQLQIALKHYFATTLKKLNHPDTYCMQIVFVARLPDGQATIKITDVAHGRNTSVVHVAVQHKGKDKFVAYASHTNLSLAIGSSFKVTNYLSPSPATASFEKMAMNCDPHWIRFTYPWSPTSLTKNFLHAERWTPRYPHAPNIQEYWFRMLPHGLYITTDMLGSLVDNYARTPENWRPGSPGSHAGMLAQAYWQQRTGEHLIEDPSFADDVIRQAKAAASSTSCGNVSAESDDPDMRRQALAYPTVMMNLEIKKKLPEEGVEWMYCRATTKTIQGGRLDADVVLMDQEGDIVATSNQVGLMLNMGGDHTRNLAASGKSKL